MAALNHAISLSLTVPDRMHAYGPSDTISGNAWVHLTEPLAIKSIVVKLFAGCRISQPGRTPRELFKEYAVLHKSKIAFQDGRQSSSEQLSPGKHQWQFEFDLPSSKTLPPSFYHHDENRAAEITYKLGLYVYTKDGKVPPKDGRGICPIKYSPRRSPELRWDTFHPRLCQSVVVRRPQRLEIDGSRGRWIPQMVSNMIHQQKPGEEKFHATLSVPRYAILSEILDISFRLQSVSEEYTHTIDVRLAKVHYHLWASTRTACEQGARNHRHKVQNNVMTSGSVIEIDSYGLQLRRHAPFRVQDSYPWHVGPSFGTQRIVREYSLDIDLFLSCYGRVYRVRFEDIELVLLPYATYLSND